MVDTALVLVGGEGTRLRPLTLTVPKPALPLVDRPFIRYVVDWLARHGVEQVVLACASSAEPLRVALGEGDEGGPHLAYLEEPEPLGTGGPVRLAAEGGLLGDRFLVLNGDLLTDLDLEALDRAHGETDATATLALVAVDDPSAYGLVRRGGEGGEVIEFTEKPRPGEVETGEVSAGAYVLERNVIDLIPPGEAVSIERQVFPLLVGRGLHGVRLDGYWMDIGTPERYLQASWDILEGRVTTDAGSRLDDDDLLVEDPGGVSEGAAVNPPAFLDRGVAARDGAEVGPRAVIGPGSDVGEGAIVSSSVLFSDCEIGARAKVSETILGPGVGVGEGATIEAGSVVGARARVEPGATLGPGARVGPGEVAA